MRTTFIGVGAIGLPMAERLLPHHDVTGFDVSTDQLDKLVAAGGHGANSPAAAARGSELVIVMVATPEQLRSAVLGPDGALAGMTAGQLLVVMSSVGVDAVQELAEALAGSGIDLLDVPVTGGVARATTGELTLLVGGPVELLDRARPVLQHLGTTLAHCGPRVGDGQAVKLVNQLLCSVHLAAAGEALTLAGTMGLDPAEVLDIVGSGAASSFMLLDRGPRMLAEDGVPVLSTVDIFVKDSGLVADAARAAGSPTPLLDVAANLFRAVSAAGHGRQDDSSVISAFQPAPL